MSESKVKIYRGEELAASGVVVKRTGNKDQPKHKKNIILRILAVIGVTLAAILIGVYLIVGLICRGPSKSARQLLVTTVLESGALKFVAGMYLSPEEIREIVNQNSMEPINEDIDPNLIKIGSETINTGGNSSSDASSKTGEEEKDIEVYDVSGRTYSASLIIVKDPSRISLETVFTGSGWPDNGKTLDALVAQGGGIAGINGGIYNQDGGLLGGHPLGVVVSHGEIQMNSPQSPSGLYLIGFNNDNILIIKYIGDMSKADFESYVKEAGIRDACVFQEESSDKNNHFVQLVINGEAREMSGMGSGLNPRTAIGQRADGAVLLLVTDGRGANSHLGASASDLINIMLKYGAVNAANLDGGSSSCMYYDGSYLKTSVTFKYGNASWCLPLAFVVK